MWGPVPSGPGDAIWVRPGHGQHCVDASRGLAVGVGSGWEAWTSGKRSWSRDQQGSLRKSLRGVVPKADKPVTQPRVRRLLGGTRPRPRESLRQEAGR